MKPIPPASRQSRQTPLPRHRGRCRAREGTTAAITVRALAVVEEVWSGKWAPSDEEAAAVAGRVRAELGRLLAS
jgi:hypothetical protein